MRPGESDSSSFLLPGHESLSPLQSSEAIANHFAEISNEYEPVSFENFSPRLKQALSSTDSDPCPTLTEFQV